VMHRAGGIYSGLSWHGALITCSGEDVNI
jgi:hypothetical protein